jgi:hypothetical protein
MIGALIMLAVYAGIGVGVNLVWDWLKLPR